LTVATDRLKTAIGTDTSNTIFSKIVNDTDTTAIKSDNAEEIERAAEIYEKANLILRASARTDANVEAAITSLKS